MLMVVVSPQPMVAASLKVMSMTRAFLKTLSLNAPRNSTRKSGRNRLDFSSDPPAWPLMCVSMW